MGGECSNVTMGGSDLALLTEKPGSGESTADWNTTGLGPTAKGQREDLALVLHVPNLPAVLAPLFTLLLQGPGGTLSLKLQAKFYAEADTHVDYGTKLDALAFKAVPDGAGALNPTDVTFT